MGTTTDLLLFKEDVLARALKAELTRLGHNVQFRPTLNDQGFPETILVVNGKVRRLDLSMCAPESMDGWTPYIEAMATNIV